MPLAYAEVGQNIKRIGGSREIRKHLEDPGFHIGGGSCGSCGGGCPMQGRCHG